MVGPYAKRVVARFAHFWSEMDGAGFDQEALVALVDGNEALEQLTDVGIRRESFSSDQGGVASLPHWLDATPMSHEPQGQLSKDTSGDAGRGKSAGKT